MKSIALLLFLTSAATYPANEPYNNLDEGSTNMEVIEDLVRELDNAAYKEHFKAALTQYVLSEYNNLTFAEREKVEIIIEELLTNVVTDFRIVLHGQRVERECVRMRMADTKFDELHRRVVSTVPNVDERTAFRLACGLERNLEHAKQRIDEVIKNSKLAYIKNEDQRQF